MQFRSDRAPAGVGVEPRPERARVADALVNILVDAGVEVVFGLPGGPISPIHDALLDRTEVRVINHRHEASALFAAAGYAQTTGKLGVAVVTSGPGILNSFTGLASAHCDGLPVLVLAGETPRHLHGKGVVQDGSSHRLRIIEMARCISKLALEVPEPGSAPTMLRRAITTALSGRRGPVVLTLPMDITTAFIDVPEVSLDISPRWDIAPRLIDRCVSAIAPGRRAALFVGSGARGGQSPEKLRAFAERAQLPVITTPKAKGVFPEDHELSLGVFGIGGHPSAYDFFAEGVDTLIIVGSSLSDLATDGWSKLLVPRDELIQVDIESSQIGRSYSPSLALVAPADLFFERMLQRTPAAPRLDVSGLRRHDDAATVESTIEGSIAPQRALVEIQRALPRDAIFTCDIGEHSVFATHYLQATNPEGFVLMNGLGSMGSSIGAALAAQLAHPDRTVAAICGDGCFAMNAFELATAVAEQLPILVFVMNDGRYGMVELGHRAVYGRTALYPTPVDAAAVARALGARSVVVDRPEQFAEVCHRSPGAPLVVDVRIDPTMHMPRKDRFDAFAGTRAGKRVMN